MRNKIMMTAAIAVALITAASVGATAIAAAWQEEGQHRTQQQQQQQQQQQGHGHSSSTHAEDVNQRGDHVMGFDHKKTTHHFLLHPDGGSIEVTANDSADKESRDQIRKHLGHIAKMFAAGNFKAPMLIHDQVPPGVPVMQRLKLKIKYDFAETERGAKVVIKSANPETLSAIHEFLRFQIKDHETGDSTKIKSQG